MRRIPDDKRAQVLSLVRSNVPIVVAARAVGISPTAARSIAATAPFAPGPQGASKAPEPAYDVDQPPPAPTPAEFRAGYHDRTYRAYSAPLAFDGFTLARVRSAISLHRMGLFLESSTLSYALLSFGPVLAATAQRIAPALMLPRQVHAGTRGLSRVLGEEVEAQVAPRDGLSPSPFFPFTVWGSVAFERAFMGFSVLQHVDGPPDADTGVRPRYTRRWPTWAVQYHRYRKTFVALTTDGPVDILNDGKFTLVANEEEPHFMGAIVALGEEALDGKFTQRSRASYINRYGNPKLWANMPEGVGVRTKEGDAMFDALSTLRGPDGFGVLPHGAQAFWNGLAGSQSTTFKDALDSNWKFVAAILLGSDGTLSKGTGVYTAPMFEGVARRLVDQDLKAAVRAANLGHVAPYLEFNYAESIRQARGWVQPVLDIPLPDPDADARIKSYSERVSKFHEIIDQERDNGFVITQERVEQLAKQMMIDPPTLGALALSREAREKSITVGEARESQGRKKLGDDRDDVLLSTIDAPAQTLAATDAIADDEPVSPTPSEGENPPVEDASADPPADPSDDEPLTES